MEPIWQAVRTALGMDAPQGALTFEQMALRALVVYACGVVMLRLASKRFLGRHTPFDMVLSIILGAVLARAINGSAPLFPTLAAALVLVLLDRLFATVAFRWDRFGDWVRGRPWPLIEDGRLVEGNMRRCHITETDLVSAVRRQAHATRLEDVASARLEPDGAISVVLRTEVGHA